VDTHYFDADPDPPYRSVLELDPHYDDADPDPPFTMMLIQILLLTKLMRICNHGSILCLYASIMCLYASIVCLYASIVRLYASTVCLYASVVCVQANSWILTYMRIRGPNPLSDFDTDPAFHSDADLYGFGPIMLLLVSTKSFPARNWKLFKDEYHKKPGIKLVIFVIKFF
jgi:hypothetical protein